MTSSGATAKPEVDEKYEQDVIPSDDGSTSTENIPNNDKEDKSPNAGEASPSKAPTATWDGPDDPDNPQNWSMKKKCSVTFFSGRTVLTGNVHLRC